LNKGYRSNGTSEGGYVTYMRDDRMRVDIRPNGEIITTKKEWLPDNSRKITVRYQWDGTPVPNGGHNTGEFVEFKNDIKFEFYDSSNGNDVGEIYCKNIFAFNYHTTFEPNEETMPCLVLDVSSSKLEKDDVRLTFEKMNYSFYFSDSPAIPKSDEYYLFKIQGGPIDVSILCQQVEVKRV